MLLLIAKFVLILLFVKKTFGETYIDYATNQLVIYNETHTKPAGTLQASNGAPIEKENFNTLNSNLLLNNYFMDSISHILRENIPERPVHGKGAGAFGYFNVTKDVTNYTKADFLNKVGKITPVVVRMSPAVTGRGGIDTNREPRGFAVKHYTKEGNFDMVGFDVPVFSFKDPVHFTGFAHSQKRNPVTNAPNDPNANWDFITGQNESVNIFTRLFGYRGVPDGYRHMAGYSIHTFHLVNSEGVSYFSRMYYVPKAGARYLNTSQIAALASSPEYATVDLYNAIKNGDFPCWTAYLQPLTESDVLSASFDPFDVTLDLTEDLYPWVEFGELCLNKTVTNYHKDVELAAYCPCNLVSGINPALDKMFEARTFAYREAQLHRLGVNYQNIEVNRPKCSVLNYNRDGVPPLSFGNGGEGPNYTPNTFNGPRAREDANLTAIFSYIQGPPDNFNQTSSVYEGYSDDEKNFTISNIVTSLSGAATILQEKAVILFKTVNSDFGSRIEEGLAAANSTI